MSCPRTVSPFHFAPLTLALALAAIGAAPSLHAQALTTEAVVTVAVPAQALGTALNTLARQAGLQLMVHPDLVAGKHAPAVSGQLSARQALERLLAGTGLVAQMDGNDVIIRAGSIAAQEKTMAPVTVSAAQERDGTTEGSASYTTASMQTATRLPLSIRETPQSVSVVTRQQMDEQNIVQQEDLVKRTTGLTFVQYGPSGSDTNGFFARGASVQNMQVDGVARLFTDYVGIFQTNDMVIYDRAEVVRGATGLMNGIGTPGATINLVRKRPTATAQASLKLTGGTWDYRRGEADIAGPVNEARTVRARLVAAVQENQSQVDYEKEKRKVLYGIVEADLAPNTLATLGFAWQDYQAQGVGRSGRPFFYKDGTRTHWQRSDSSGARWASADRENRSYFASLEHQFGNGWRAKATLTRDSSDYTEVPGWTDEFGIDKATGTGVGLWSALWAGKPVQDTLDVYANGPVDLFGRRHELVLGATSSRTRNDTQGHGRWSFPGWSNVIENIFTWDGNTPVKPNNPPNSDIHSTERTNSVYATARIKATDTLALVLGSRVTNWKRSQSETPFDSKITDRSNRQETGEFTPYAGVVYDVSRDWSVYGSYTNIFQPQNNKGADGSYLDPLLGNSYEAGVKGALLDKRLNVTAALYKTRQDNFAVSIPGAFAPDGSQAYRAATGTTSRGLELEVAGQLATNWQGMAGFARNMSADSDGKQLNTEVPQSTFKVFTSYRLPELGGAGAGGLNVGGGVRWQNHTRSDMSYLALPGDPIIRQGSYVLADAMLQYAFSKTVSMSVNVNNLFDKHYQVNSNSSYYGEGRNVRVGLAFKL